MAPNYAPHIHIRGEGGSVFLLDLPLHESIEHKLLKGIVQRVNADGSPYAGDGPAAAGLPTSRPANGAVKAVWVGWAVACGAATEAADGMTKADLIDAYGDAKPPIEPDGAAAAEQAAEAAAAAAQAAADKAAADAAAAAAAAGAGGQVQPPGAAGFFGANSSQ
jgi:hypothetical protein